MSNPSTARVFHTQQVHYFRRAITFSETGTLTIGVIPAGAVVINAGVVVTTSFNAGTANTLDIGTSADTDGFATLLALGTVGRIVADEMATSNDLYSTSEVTLQCVVTLTGTAATTGAGFVYVEYIV
jgi:hypothetical protein